MTERAPRGAWVERGPVLCLVRRTTGLPCPGCGMTRALVYLAAGEPRAAVRSHPLAPVLAAWALVIAAARVLGLTERLAAAGERTRAALRRIPYGIRGALAAAAAVVWAGWTVARWRDPRWR